jgi:hypothetical protein
LSDTAAIDEAMLFVRNANVGKVEAITEKIRNYC